MALTFQSREEEAEDIRFMQKHPEYEPPRFESTCRVVLDDKPCRSPKFLYALCHAWYAMKKHPQEESMREIFVSGLAEGRFKWEKECPL